MEGVNVFQYYFSYEDQLPENVGFALFGPIHTAWLIAILVFGFIIIMMYKKCDNNGKCKCEKMIAIIMVLLDLYKDIVLIATDNFHVWDLPLDMCTLAIYISFVHALTHTPKTWDILYCLCMPGALAALIFPNWNYYPQINFMNINSFVIHGLIVIYSMMLLFCGTIRPNIRHYINVWIFLAALLPVAWLINYLYDTNFLFLNVPSRDSPLETIYDITGAKWYLLGFAAVVFTVHLIMYIPFIVSNRRSKVKISSAL